MRAGHDDPSPIVEQLVSRYPDHGRDEIEVVVARHWQTYAAASVRAFVPILVTRQAVADLRRG